MSCYGFLPLSPCYTYSILKQEIKRPEQRAAWHILTVFWEELHRRSCTTNKTLLLSHKSSAGSVAFGIWRSGTWARKNLGKWFYFQNTLFFNYMWSRFSLCKDFTNICKSNFSEKCVIPENMVKSLQHLTTDVVLRIQNLLLKVKLFIVICLYLLLYFKWL